MIKRKAVLPAVAADGQDQHLEWGTVTHFRIVGKERIEVEAADLLTPGNPRCHCTPCGLDRAIAALGGENLL